MVKLVSGADDSFCCAAKDEQRMKARQVPTIAEGCLALMVMRKFYSLRVALNILAKSIGDERTPEHYGLRPVFSAGSNASA